MTKKGQRKKFVHRNIYKRIEHNVDLMRLTACLVSNSIKVTGNIFAAVLNCTTVGRIIDSMTDQY